MKGIILAGGSGTRLYPLTKVISKQLLPVADKPMFYYPLSTLMTAGIKDILFITTEKHQPFFKEAFGDGAILGMNIEYIVQPSPDGLAQAFLLGEDFIGDDECALVLGDNIFHGNGLEELLENAVKNAEAGYATIFGNQVKDPNRFGIMELDDENNVLSVEEKPANPKSNYAITGLYFYPKGVSEKAKLVKKSARGEYEITDLNDIYLQEKKLKAELLGEGYTWFDTGTHTSINEATNMINTIQNNKGIIISCPEQIAYSKGWTTDEQLLESAKQQEKSEYGQYLYKVLEKKTRR